MVQLVWNGQMCFIDYNFTFWNGQMCFIDYNFTFTCSKSKEETIWIFELDLSLFNNIYEWWFWHVN